MIKAIVFDLDGTAIPNKHHAMPSQAVIDAVAAAQGSLKLCAATGRPITNAKPILTALGLTDPCVISAGTQIIDPVTDQILWETVINSPDVHAIIDICQPYDYEILIRNELLGEGHTASELQVDGHVNVMYVMGCSPKDAAVMIQKLSAIKGITASEVVSWTNHGVDIHITNVEATKEHAVTELLRILDLSIEEVVGVGDADNDVHLFAAVGHKVAMGNATERLKSLADEVVASADEDGLATLIKEYFQAK